MTQTTTKSNDPQGRGYWFRDADADQTIRQIGIWTIAAISGGKVFRRRTGIVLPVRYGYEVTVDLNADDTYVVRRIFRRGTKSWVKKEWTGVYADEVGEISYRASCYHHDYPGEGEVA